MNKEKLSDCWETPQWLIEELNAEFSFDIDLCATKENTKCKMFYIDYLNDVQVDTTYYAPRVATMKEYKEVGNANWTCFMNPPYSNPRPFIEKAWEDSKYCKIVCLVKCDPSTKWWATFWNYEVSVDLESITNDDGVELATHRFNFVGPKSGCEVRFFPKRIKFDPPPGLCGKSGHTFPCALVIMDRRRV